MPPLRLRDDLVGHHEHVAVGEVRGRRGHDQPREIVARPHGRAAAASGMTPSAVRRTPAAHGPCRRRRGRADGARRGSTGRGRAGARARRTARRGRRACRRRGRAPATSSTPYETPAASRGRHVALEAPGAEARLDRVRRREHERVGAGAVTVGHDHHGLRRGDQLARAPRGCSSGVSPGTSTARSKPSAQGVPQTDQGGLRLAGLRGVRKDPDARPRTPPTRRRGPRSRPRSASSSRVRRSALRTSANMAWASAWRDPAPSESASRCFAAPKLFTGRMAIVRAVPAIVQAQRPQGRGQLEHLACEPRAGPPERP